MKYIIFSLVLLSSLILEAAYVERVKNNKALIFLDGLNVQRGDLVNVLNSAQKTVGILRISNIKDGKAVGNLVKGRVAANLEVTFRSASVRSTNRPQQQAPIKETVSSDSNFKSKLSVGGLLGIGMDSMDVRVGAPIRTVGLSGMGFSLFGAADYSWIPLLSIRAQLGLEQFKAEGNTTAGASCLSCTVDISYLGAMGWGRLHLLSNLRSLWVGPGAGYFLPMSKSSNALDSSSIKSTFVFGVGGGFDYSLNDKQYIPIQIEYIFLNDSEDVKASYIGIKAGFMMKF